MDGLTLLLNGRSVAFGPPATHTTLLDFVRARGLTGAKEGCAEGECGACALVAVVDEGGRPAYRAVTSCLIPLPLAADHEFLTVESLAVGGELADAQQAMAAGGASQCGYCTPGFVMSLFAEQYRRGREGPCDPAVLAGNLCRCTGYRPIRDAALAVGPAPAGSFLERLSHPAPHLEPRHGPGFSRPGSLSDCLQILTANHEARIVSGGTDYTVEANLHGRHARHLVGLDALVDIRGFSEDADTISIGAALPLTDLERRWSDAPPVVREWLALFASPLVRNRATLGGNLATASPIGDAAPLLLALDARVAIGGASGARTLPLASFFVGYRQTALRPGELITHVEIPRPLPALIRFYKIAKRRFDDISTVAAAFALDLDDERVARRVRMAFGGVAATPVRVVEAENAVSGRVWDESAVARAARAIDATLRPIGDHRGSAAYRLAVSKSLVEKFWWETRP
jgi:xanthine dehydrogenase small subunit